MTPEKLLPALEKQAPSVAEEHAPSNEAVATDIPSANAPDPTAANPEVNPMPLGINHLTRYQT